MNYVKLKELRCKAWGVDVTNYEWDFDKKDMARAYRRGKNKGLAHHTLMKAEEYQKYIDVCKENQELKEKLKPENCLKLLAKDGYIKFTSDQLTKAKEIISEFVKWANWQGNSKCPSFKSIQDKAEQFLKEE